MYQIFAYPCKDYKLAYTDNVEEAYKILLDNFGESHQETLATKALLREHKNSLE